VVGAGDLVDDPKKIAVRYLQSYFLLDLFVVLPLPQVNFFSSSSISYELCFFARLIACLDLR